MTEQLADIMSINAINSTSDNNTFEFGSDNENPGLLEEPQPTTINTDNIEIEEDQSSQAVDATKVYFNDLRKSKLLTADEEKYMENAY